MNNVYFTGDLHLGDKRILEFEGDYRCGSTVDEHDQWLFDCWHARVNKKDKVYVLGDVALTPEKLEWFGSWTGRKVLVRGNHDTLKEGIYRDIFEAIHGITQYKGHWLTHAPMHPMSLRDKPNIHGHLHHLRVMDGGVPDVRYKSVCVEAFRGYPAKLGEL
jgi:calcineurin-like phosphoesterase family protein